jgi:hypothetical protein
MSDRISAVCVAVADALHGWSLDGTGGNLIRAYATPVDSVTAPAAVVAATGAAWSDTGRSDGSVRIDVTVTIVLPLPSAAVGAALANAALSGVRQRLSGGFDGRHLGGSCLAWRLTTATVGTTPTGDRAQGSVTVQLQVWMKE